jgi:cobalamin biosynthesis Mg chelatase CobN
MNFTVPANTNYDNCVRKTLQLVVDKSGYFYVAAYPKVSQNATVSIVRRVGIKVELAYPTQTTTSSSVSGGAGNVQTTTTTTGMLKNQSFTTTTIRNLTATTLTQNGTKNETGANISSTKSEKPTFDLTKVIIAIIVVVALIGFSYFLAAELGLV